MAIWDIKERNKKVRANEIRGSRGFFMGGTTPSGVTDIYQIDITSTGNASDFGGNLQAEQGSAGKGCNAGSSTRIVYGGGGTEPAAPANGASTQISYFTPIHSGNASDFGDLTLRRASLISLSNNTRAIFGGGYDYAGAPAGSGSNVNIIDYVTIQSLGNAVDFGDLQQVKQNNASVSSTTRGIWAGGHAGGAGTLDQIDYITIASAGDAADFGDLSAISESFAGSGNNIIGIVGGGNQGPYIGMDKITIASTGGGTDFGDLTQARRDLGSTSNQIRQLFAGGAAPGITNIIDFLQIASLGDCADFGDLAAANRGLSGSSVSHNGLELGFFQRPSVTYMPGSGRALFGGGYSGGHINVVEKTHIPTLGNSSDWGNLTVATFYWAANLASLTRGFFAGGRAASDSDVINSFEFASEGNGSDFGNLSAGKRGAAGCNSLTRGIVGGGASSPGGGPGAVNVIDYITMASAGDTSDFGDLSGTRYNFTATSSSVRGVFSNGNVGPGGPITNIMEYITIDTTGNTTDFGDSTVSLYGRAACASPTRGVFGGGDDDSNKINTIDYITIASTGDATDFGDLTAARRSFGSASSRVRGTWGGGYTPSASNVIDYVTIASTGDAADFGDLTAAKTSNAACSDSNGGLSG